MARGYVFAAIHFFIQTCGFAGAIAKEVKPCATNVAGTQDF